MEETLFGEWQLRFNSMDYSSPVFSRVFRVSNVKFAKVCFHESSRFTIHFTFKMIAAILTAATCVIAIIRFADKKSSPKEYPHLIISLVVFIKDFHPTSAADCGRRSCLDCSSREKSLKRVWNKDLKSGKSLQEEP